MRNQTILSKEITITIIIVILLVGSICISIIKFEDYKEFSFYNRSRILVTDELITIEDRINSLNGNFTSEAIGTLYNGSAQSYPYVLLDLEGKALNEAREFNLKKGERVNLKEVVQFDNSFYQQNKKDIRVAFILESTELSLKENATMNKRVLGFVLFLIPREELLDKSEVELILSIFTPVMAAIILTILFIIYRGVYLKKHILIPMREISESSQAILSGNYDIPVVKIQGKYINNSEVDELTYEFELMRDKLKENKGKEDQLKRSQKELISCISHDLKTPVSTIKAYSEGLRDGMADTKEKRKKYCDVLVKKAELLNHMISDLLEHSNAELNELKIIKKEHYFLKYIKKIDKEIKELVEHHGFIYESENRVPDILVTMDDNRITQVITNLIDNSMKYTNPEGGIIRITTDYDKINHTIIISVKDNGNGISTEDIPYVFDLFYRAEKSRTMSIPGTGLGLSISKYIIEQHGGTISCNSKAGAGTEFIVQILE